MPEVTAADRFSPQDVLVGLLAFISGQSEKFRADAVGIHKALATLKQEKRYSGLLKGLAFDRRDYFPYCDFLEETLDALQLGGYLDRTNPRGVYYQIRPSLRSMFEKEIKQRFGETQLPLLEEASQAFYSGIKP